MRDDPQARSELMSRIRSSGTKPERTVRSMLHGMGFRFRLNRKDLPGRPDLVLPRHKLAIFVHGCFWHQHAGCRLASDPKSHRSYWGPKLKANVARDARVEAALTEAGWRVEVIWECTTRKPDQLAHRLADVVRHLTE